MPKKMYDDYLDKDYGELYQDIDQGWIQLDPPVPDDSGLYDILLEDGTVVFGVARWNFGGGFSSDEFSSTRERLVEYSVDSVIAFRPTK